MTVSPQGRSQGPTVPRRLLGARLRQLRLAAGLTGDVAGESVLATGATISRMENGLVGITQRKLAALLTLYEASDHESDQLLELNQQAGKPGWWQDFKDILPSWFQTYVGLEGSASQIRIYEMQLIPGLLQTQDYARAVLTIGADGSNAEAVEGRVAFRMARQQLLIRQAAPQIWAVIDEGALRRRVGSAAVMRAQLEHLRKLIELPNLTLQVLTYDAPAGVRIVEGGPFTILRFGEPELPDIVYVEQFTSAFYLDKPGDLDRYLQGFNFLSIGGNDLAATDQFLSQILKEFPDDP